MKAKWIAWTLAAALCLVASAALAQPERGGADAPAAAEAEPGRLDPPDDLDLLLAAGHGPRHDRMGRPGRIGPGRGRGPAARLPEGLELTEAQRSKLADIREKRMRAAIPTQGDLRIASLDLRKLLRAEKPDARAIDAQIDRIATLRATQEKGRVAARLEARAVLTPEQQKVLREHRGGMPGRHMRGGPGMRRHGGPGMGKRGGAPGPGRDI